MRTTHFPTAQDAEQAFYEALQKADLELMTAVWADEEEVYCIHPGGPPLAGIEAVMSSWRQILRNGQGLRIEFQEQQRVDTVMLAVHRVHEHIAVSGSSRNRQLVVATNVYHRTAAGWRMVAHHATAAAEPARREPDPTPGPPQTLH